MMFFKPDNVCAMKSGHLVLVTRLDVMKHSMQITCYQPMFTCDLYKYCLLIKDSEKTVSQYCV